MLLFTNEVVILHLQNIRFVKHIKTNMFKEEVELPKLSDLIIVQMIVIKDYIQNGQWNWHVSKS